MVCETCTDAIDDTSSLTLADHDCHEQDCTCRCHVAAAYQRVARQHRQVTVPERAA